MKGRLIIYTKKNSQYSIKVNGNMKHDVMYQDLADYVSGPGDLVHAFVDMTNAISKSNTKEYDAMTPEQLKKNQQKVAKAESELHNQVTRHNLKTRKKS